MHVSANYSIMPTPLDTQCVPTDIRIKRISIAAPASAYLRSHIDPPTKRPTTPT